MDSQNPNPDIQNISTENVVPKKKYIRKAKETVIKEINEAPNIETPVNKEISLNIELPPKTKRGQSEKTKAALAEGRRKLAELNAQKRVDKALFINEKVNKKAERIAEEKIKMLKELELDDEDEDESILADVKPKAVKVTKELKEAKIIEKAVKKKPKVVYISEDEEEEEEEEIVYKIKPKGKTREKKVELIETPKKPLYSSITFY